MSEPLYSRRLPMALAGTLGMPTSNRAALGALQSRAANPFGFGPDPFAARGRRPNKYTPHVGEKQMERQLRRCTVFCSGRPGADGERRQYLMAKHRTAVEQAWDPHRVSGAALKGRTSKRRRAYLAA